MKYIYLLIALFFSIMIHSQGRITNYCKCESKGAQIAESDIEKGVSLSSHYFDGQLEVKIRNNTADTIFIFKSYFDDDISKSEYLYRYDKKSNTVNISYLPLLPYLFTKYSDRVILKDRIISDYQVVFDFYRILPFNDYSFSVATLNFKEKSEFIKDFDTSTLSKFEKIKGIKKKKCVKGTKPTFYVNLAYYYNVQTLCNANSYFQEELKFNEAAKNFKVIRCKLD